MSQPEPKKRDYNGLGATGLLRQAPACDNIVTRTMSAQTRTEPSHPFSILGDALESAAESLEQATANAPESARRAAQTTRRALGTGFYKACYGLSFGVVYSAVFIAELVPENSTIARAFREGADAAREARHRVRTARAKAKPAPAADAAEVAIADRSTGTARHKAAKTARKTAPAPRRTQRQQRAAGA